MTETSLSSDQAPNQQPITPEQHEPQQSQNASRQLMYLILISIVLIIIAFGAVLTGSIARNPRPVPSVTPVPTSQTPAVTNTRTPLSPTLTLVSPTVPSDSTVKTYESKKLGISFTYRTKSEQQNFYVKESNDKVCITTNNNDTECTKGQFIQVFEKSKDETLADAINKRFLQGKSPKECWVEPYTLDGYPENIKAAEIVFPILESDTMVTIEQKSQACSTGYARTNGIRYFLTDTKHPTQYGFVNIGQYAIPGGDSYPWQDTIQFTK